MNLDASQTDHDEPDAFNAATSAEPRRIVVLNRDLFFGVNIGNTLRSLGYTVEFAQEAESFARQLGAGATPVVLGIVDINAGVDWTVITKVSKCGVPILAFGSHLDVDGMRSAKNAGVTRVVSNGDFHRDMVKLVNRYALESPQSTF
jgi:hypothetical protein